MAGGKGGVTKHDFFSFRVTSHSDNDNIGKYTGPTQSPEKMTSFCALTTRFALEQ